MNILVIGESCKDVFVYGDCSRLCPEAPIPVLNYSETKETQGMAANVVNNLYSCGADNVVLATNNNVIKKVRYIDRKTNYMLLRVDENDHVDSTFNFDNVDFSAYDAVVVSDYCKGFLTEAILREISYKHKLTFLDTKKPLSTGLS